MTPKLIRGLSAGALLAVSLSGSGRAGTASPTPLPDYRQAAYVLADGREREQNGVAVWADATSIALATYDRVEVFGGTTYNQVTGIRLPSAHATIGLGGIGGDSRYLYAAETYDDAVDVIRRTDWSIVTSVYINQPYKIAVNTSYFACAGNPTRIWRKADFSLLTNLGIQAGDLYANDSCFLAGDLTSKAWKVYDAASFALATAIARPPAATQVYGGGVVGDDYLLATYSGDTSLYVHSQADFSLHTVIPGRNSAVYDSVSWGKVCAVNYGNFVGEGLRFYLADGDWSLLTMMTGGMFSPWNAMGVHDGKVYLPAASAFYVYSDGNGAPAKSVGGLFLLGTGEATLFWRSNGNAHRVEWGTDGAAYTEESDFADAGWNHSFALPLPENGDACYYRAWTEGKLMCEDAIALADARFNAFTMGLLADQQSRIAAWSASTQLHGRYHPDFSVSLGDQVENAYWSSFMEWYGWEYPWLRQTPKIAVLGNHDDELPWNDFYPVPYDGCYYSFEIGNVHFSVIDTGCELSIKKGTAQWNWLSGDLWSATQPWKIILSHVGPYTAIYAHGIQDPTCASDVVPLAKAAGVKAWVYGHNHMAQHIVVDGIDYIHVPAACGCYSYTQQTDWPDVRFYSQTEGFGLLSCQSETLSFSYYDFSGEKTYGPISIESPTPTPAGERTPTPPPPPSPAASATPSPPPTPAPASTPTPLPSATAPGAPTATPPPSPTPTCGPPLPPERAVTASGDYDGDGTAEPAVFRPATGLWSVAGLTRAFFGGAGDRAAPADFDGDGACGIAVFRAEGGLWSVRFLTRFYIGSSGDWPLPGDYDGEGTDEAGLFRPASGEWMVRSLTRFYLGSSADRPVPGDYGGEGRRIAAVYRPCSGLWSIRDLTRIYFGNCFDSPLPADLDGDGTDDAVLFRSSAGMWSARNLTRLYFGSTGDVAVTR